MIELLIHGQIASSVIMLFAWLIALRIRNTSYVDVVWAYGVGVIGLYFLHQCSSQCSPQRLALLQGLLGVWSIRLGTHLLRRCQGKPEDVRYAYLRDYFGPKANLGFFVFFQVQAFWIVLFACPFLILVRNQTELQLWDHLGLIIWVCGFVGVSLSDRQLSAFKRVAGRTRKEVCETGLWKYSRHPNYFFEWVLWLGYLPLALHSQGGIWLLALPPVLFIFLTKITGIPFVEARKLEAGGEAYASYLKRTPSFFPRIPTKPKSPS
jgi:steroid 5-alpha reductase family enzyme